MIFIEDLLKKNRKLLRNDEQLSSHTIKSLKINETKSTLLIGFFKSSHKNPLINFSPVMFQLVGLKI